MTRHPVAPDDQQTIDAFLDALWMERGLRQNTLTAYGIDLRGLAAWLEGQGVDLLGARRQHLQGFLAYRVSAGLRMRSIRRLLTTLKRFYRYQVRVGRLTEDPSARIDSPRLGRPLPDSLSEAEIESLLEAPDVATSRGLRDRAMLEIMYACGLRVSELVGLRAGALNRTHGVLRLQGKGGKERLVPVGEEALDWVERYIREGRPALLRGRAGTDALFVTARGAAMTRQAFWYTVRRYAAAAGIEFVPGIEVRAAVEESGVLGLHYMTDRDIAVGAVGAVGKLKDELSSGYGPLRKVGCDEKMHGNLHGTNGTR